MSHTSEHVVFHGTGTELSFSVYSHGLQADIKKTLQKELTPFYSQEALAFLNSLEDASVADNNFEGAKTKIKEFLSNFTDFDANRLTLASTFHLAIQNISAIRDRVGVTNYRFLHRFCDALLADAKQILDRLPSRTYSKKGGEHQFFLSYTLLVHKDMAICKALEKAIKETDEEAQALFADIHAGKEPPSKFIDYLTCGGDRYQKGRLGEFGEFDISNKYTFLQPWPSNLSAKDVFQIYRSLISDPENNFIQQGDMWKGRAISLVSILSHLLVYLRDHEGVTLSLRSIMDYFALKDLEPLAHTGDEKYGTNFFVEISSPLKHYLMTLPGYDLLRFERGQEQSASTQEQHDYITMQITRIINDIIYQINKANPFAGYSHAEIYGAIKGERRKEIADAFRQDWNTWFLPGLKKHFQIGD